MAARIPHTYRRNGMYYVRFKWPNRIARNFPDIGKEFNRSLCTNKQHLARHKASNYISSLHSLIAYLDRLLASDNISSIEGKDLIESVVGYSKMSEEFDFTPLYQKTKYRSK